MATFTFTYSPGVTLEVTPRVLSAKFGDGYEQRTKDGINIKSRMWNIAFIGKSITVADSIEAFLVARDGVEAFNWTPPSGTAGIFICRKWQRVADTFNTASITVLFEEVFGEPAAP